jgi:hypothetical protein
MLATHIQVVLDRAAGHQLAIARAAAWQVFRMSDARNVGRGRDEQVRCNKNWSEWAGATTVQPLEPATSCQSFGRVFGDGLKAAAAVLAISVSVSLLKPATPTAPTTSPSTRTGMPPRSAMILAVTNAVRP